MTLLETRRLIKYNYLTIYYTWNHLTVSKQILSVKLHYYYITVFEILWVQMNE